MLSWLELGKRDWVVRTWSGGHGPWLGQHYRLIYRQSLPPNAMSLQRLTLSGRCRSESESRERRSWVYHVPCDTDAGIDFDTPKQEDCVIDNICHPSNLDTTLHYDLPKWLMRRLMQFARIF